MRRNIEVNVESLRGALENIAEKQVRNDDLQQKLDGLNNKFQEDS